MDPAVRKFLIEDVLSFASPAGRFVEICENISKSFLKENKWIHMVEEKNARH